MSRRRATWQPPILDERGDASPGAIVTFLLAAVLAASILAFFSAIYWPVIARES